MKKIISLFLICMLLCAFCACGEKQLDPTNPVEGTDMQNISDGNVSDGNIKDENAQSDPVTEVQVSIEAATVNNSVLADATIPAVENYTFVAEKTKNVTNFTFEGEMQSTPTCNKMIMINKDGTTEISVSFAEDGSGLTVYTLQPDGTKYTTLARFDRQGKLVGIFNGSGSYSDYIYGDDNTCVLIAYDEQGEQFDYRKYYYDDNEILQKVERGDGQTVQETYDYTTDDDGKEISMRVSNDTGYILYEYSYDENGHPVCRRIEQNNEFYGLQLYTYDKNGKRITYTFRNDENAPHEQDMTVNYNNVYGENGIYLGTAEVDSQTGEVYIAVAYDYITTEYPHYAEFLEDHFMTY